MTRNLFIIALNLALLAICIFAASNVFSLPIPGSSSDYRTSFGFSPNDDDGADDAFEKLQREWIRAAKDDGGKWYRVTAKMERGT